jgi:leucine-zipper of insertion element IS481
MNGLSSLPGSWTARTVCRDFNVSRKTGYKILNCYNDVGLEGLTDRSRRPYRHANQNFAGLGSKILGLSDTFEELASNIGSTAGHALS